jgi:hypothetical protein
MIRVIEHKTNIKEEFEAGVIKTLDTDTGRVDQYDYIVGNEDRMITSLLINLDRNGILKDYEDFLPENPKVLKHERN